MPKSKSRKKPVRRTVKKRLVFEFAPDGSTHTYLPSYTTSRQKWIGVISSEENNSVDEYEIKTQERLMFGEFLATIRGELPDLIPDVATGCRVQVFVRS